MTVLIAAAVLFVLPAVCHAGISSVAILPLKNETGDASLDWLSIGLQDAITLDLYYVEGLDTISIPQYITVINKSVEELSNFSKYEAVWFGSRTNADQVWFGSYEMASGGSVTIEMQGLNVKTESIIFSLSVTSQPDKLLSAESSLVIKAVQTAGFKLTDNQENRILTPKTRSLRAFKLNAQGYEIQQRYSLSVVRQGFFEGWISTLNEAVSADPSYAEAWVNLGWAYYTAGEMDKSLNAFETARRLKPFLIDGNMGVGYVLREYKEDYDKAIRLMSTALSTNQSLEWPNEELIKTVRQANYKAALPYVMDMLGDERKKIRIAAIEALGHLSDASSLSKLSTLLYDSDVDIRYATIKSIGEIGTDAAIPYLEKALDSSNEKREIVLTILYVDENAGVPHLIEMLQNTSSDDCIFAAQELGMRGVVSAIPHLTDAVKGPEELSLAALRALANIGDISAMPAIIETLKDKRVGVRTVAVAILGDYQAYDAIPSLWEMAKEDGEPYVRLRALISLAQMGEEDAINSLVKVVRGDNKEDADYVITRVLQRPYNFVGTKLEFVFEEFGSTEPK